MTVFAARSTSTARRRLRGRPRDHARHHLLGVQARDQRDRASTPPGAASPARRTASRSPATTCRPRRSSASPGLIYLYGFDGFMYSIGCLVAFLTVMFLLAERMRNAGKYTFADVLAFRLRERPARVAAAHRHARRRGLLPDRADGRRGRADQGAGRHRLHARGADHRRVHARLRPLRRHGRDDLGADHQGRAADGRHRRDVDLRARQGRLQPDRAVQPGRGGERRPRIDVLARPGHLPARTRSTRCRSGSRWCSAPRACRTS